jgi:hypothetical protein
VLRGSYGTRPGFGVGDGAEIRQPLGISIVGGLLVSQVLTLSTTLVMYFYLDRFERWSSRPWARVHPERPPAEPAEVPIGIGDAVTRVPLPHHRTCGSASGGSAG